MMRTPFARHFIPAIAAAASLALPAAAQDRLDAPDIREMEARLENRHVLFGVQIDRPVTDDLLEAGRLVAMGGSEAGGSGMACVSCHGAEGRGDGSGAFPRLSGQAGWYLYKQLTDYASGARPNQVMSSIAQRLTRNEMEAVAAYYAAIDAPFLPAAGTVDGETLQWGGQLGAAGSSELGVPACVNCHGPDGMGNPPSVPYLAGQHASYMALQLQLWKDGTRDNDPMNVMSAIASKLTEEDMRAVSEYYARVRPPEREPIGQAQPTAAEGAADGN